MNFLTKLLQASHLSRMPRIVTTASLHTSPTANGAKNARILEAKFGLPEKPRRPINGFFRYVIAMKPEAMKNDPSFDWIRFVKDCSIKWENLNDSQKSKYNLEFKQDMANYVKAHADFYNQLSEEQKQLLIEAREKMYKIKERRALVRKNREYNQPKKPVAAFLMFKLDSMHEYKREEGKGIQSYYDFVRKMRTKWFELPEEVRQSYRDRFRKKYDEYSKAITAWEQEMASLGNLPLLRRGTFIEANARRKKILRIKGRPTKGPEFI